MCFYNHLKFWAETATLKILRMQFIVMNAFVIRMDQDPLDQKLISYFVIYN